MTNIKNILQLPDNQRRKMTNSGITIFFILVTISILFIPFIILLIKTNNRGLVIPKEFTISTMLAIISTLLTQKLKIFKSNDALKKYRLSLLMIVLTGLSFLCFQYDGWVKILHGNNSQYANILNVLLIVHAVHFIMAIVLPLILLSKAFRFQDGADMYIHFLNSKQATLFSSSLKYCGFISGLWIFLYVVLLLQL